ncbi:MAG TPA: glutamate--tRNA ligase [Rhodospirillaceae bacterium]|nr:glutamate--tRNA ligase [Rhodospirillaceae bacterium]MBL25419.1 glutamate--tRNA ligase [Rhodospirillaceae bacterium]HAT36075.1 glutamate--tRNA ligase [Rhodospirillaceae bacterium]
MDVVTRFAPSPTGFLHIGGARTALFNWLFARHHGGRYLLRIEDTDIKRSTPEAIKAIEDGLAWLGLDHDGDIIFQSKRRDLHAAAVKRLLDEGKAYRCYCSPEELKEMREQARAEGRSTPYDRRWRDRDASDAPQGVEPAIRIKMPLEGETIIEDLVQGAVTVRNEELDDFILLRSDGTPTYMHSVVVDDHDMGITHVIRGDDHLNNAFRQFHLYKAFGWEPPEFAHIPLIHGGDGQKLSKRHGALGVEAYREMGYLPDAIRNYLLRLGWSHGDDEIISSADAIAWFGLDSVGKAPSRFDFERLESLNGHYISERDNQQLIDMILPELQDSSVECENTLRERLLVLMGPLKERVKNLRQLSENAGFVAERPAYPLANAKAAKCLNEDGLGVLTQLHSDLSTAEDWDIEGIEAHIRTFAEAQELGLGKIAQPLRAALTGSNASPGIFEVLVALGRDESLARIAAVPGVSLS